ncbi:hypothetical protein NIES4071_43360 [Calothrix sp. NIES-4071]|nr:hypothetical protein NIES4071_43360 [Calothrix sp. NIES-4071]BAZ58650.1 hypothetical protein NIES4105_43290 [Calothrix sp. NIES-4105]
MQKPPNQDSQPQNQLYLSRRPVSFLLFNAVAILAVIGMARILIEIFNTQQILKPAVGVEAAVKPPIVQPATRENIKHIESKNKGNQQREQGNAIILPWKNFWETPRGQEHQQLTQTGKRIYYPSKMFTVNANTLIANLQPLNKEKPQQNFLEPQSRESHATRTQVAFGLHPSTSIPVLTENNRAPEEIQSSSSPKAFSGGRERKGSVSYGESSIKFKLTAQTQAHQTPTAAALISQNQFSLAENSRKQNQQQSLPLARTIALRISDIVALALANNRTIKNSYLERIAQRQDLAVEEDKFAPQITPTLLMSAGQSGTGTTTTNDIGLEAKMKIPTGGELSVGLTNNALMPKITFNQPLLRGFGVDVNRASIQTARLTEKTNILGLKLTLINTITDAILAYRNLLRAQERLKIEQLSLKSAQEILEINKALIAAGRLAPVEIIQSETAIANRQVSLVAAQNTLESAKLALLQILDIDQNTNIVAAEIPKALPVALDSNKLRQLALSNHPDYLQAQLNLDKAKLDLLQAKNNRRWDLGLNISYDNTTVNNNTTPDVRAGLTFSKTLGDRTPEQRFQRSRVNLLQTENNLKEQLESLEIQVTDRIRDVNLSFSQVQLARQARESSERQLEIEREKQRLGRGSGVFEIVSLQDSLVEARNAELNATIEYLNALTNLDRSVGTTLDSWQVKIETTKS